MSLKMVKSSLLGQIGFNEEEQQVYLTILGIGSASLGEIYLQSGFPLEELQTIVQDLHNRGYLKKIEGRINRYIAIEPFLKGFLFVEKEFQNDIINIENSLLNVYDTNYEKFSKRIDEFKISITPIFTKVIGELKVANEKLKMELTNSIYRHSDKVSKLAENFDVMLNDGFNKTYLSISNELSNLSNEITVILREEADLATERLQKFEELSNKAFQDMKQPLDDAVIEYESLAPDKLKELLEENKNEILTVQKNIKTFTKTSMKDLTDSMKEIEKQFLGILTNAIDGYSKVVSSYKSSTHALIDTQRKKIDNAVIKLIDIIGKNIDQLSSESISLKNNIDELSKAGLLKKPDPRLVHEAKNRAGTIDSLSQKIKSAYDEALNSYKKDVLDGILELMKQNDGELASQLKSGSDQLKELKGKVSIDWVNIAKKFDADLNDVVKDLLKDSHPKITESTKATFENTLKYIEQLKGKFTDTLQPLREVIFSDLEEFLENMFLNTSKRLRMHNDTNTKNLETIRYLTDNVKFTFKQLVQEELLKPKTIASDMITEYTNTLDTHITSINRDQTASIDKIGSAADKFLIAIKDSYTNAGNEISNRLAAIIYKVNETKTYLQEITNSVDQIKPVPKPHSLIIYGNQNSMNAMSDMLLRTQSTCTIVVPTIDQKIVDLITKQLSKRVRIRILADIDPFKDEALIASLKENGNITVWAYTMRDFYAVTRDGAEVLLAPIARDGELTSFLTEQDALVRAVQQIINASFMARSKEII